MGNIAILCSGGDDISRSLKVSDLTLSASKVTKMYVGIAGTEDRNG